MRIPNDDPLSAVAAAAPGIAAAQATQIAPATIRAFDATTFAATVQLSGSAITWLSGIPVNTAIPIGLVRDGARCAVAFFNPADPTDACVLAVFGRPPGVDDPRLARLDYSLLNAAVLGGTELAYLDEARLGSAVLG